MEHLGRSRHALLFAGLKQFSPFSPLASNKWLTRPVCASAAGGTVLEQFIPARLSHRPAKVKETSVNQETAGHTFTQAVLEREAAFLFPQIINHLYLRKRCATSLLGREPPSRSSSWFLLC